MRAGTIALVSLLAATAAVAGDASSLLKSGKTATPPVVNDKGEEVVASSEPTVANTSLIAVEKPKIRQFKLHDIVTIVVREESTSKSNADAKTDKSLKLNADLKNWLKFHNGSIIPDEGIDTLNPKIDVSMDRTYEGKGDANRKDSFLTKIAAEVIDVKPNGTLVLEAKRFVKTDDEEITLTLTGNVRPADVNIDNSVNSTSVAELTVSKTTRGIARDGQKRGWLARLLDAINPF
jgi:flagellar L-ring protein precursor FlgH